MKTILEEYPELCRIICQGWYDHERSWWGIAFVMTLLQDQGGRDDLYQELQFLRFLRSVRHWGH